MIRLIIAVILAAYLLCGTAEAQQTQQGQGYVQYEWRNGWLWRPFVGKRVMRYGYPATVQQRYYRRPFLVPAQ